MARRLILWDVDGTLVSCGPAGRQALETAASQVAALDVVPYVEMSGKTDPQILAEILAAAGLGAAEIDTLMPAAIAAAEAALEARRTDLLEAGFVHPGVSELLRCLATSSDVRQTLVTGNVARNAALKVSTFGLENFFDFEIGAYGTDHADRNCLVPIALERARMLRSARYASDEVWVIGDTRHDLSCARAAGVRCILVGTGRVGYDAVRDLDADAVVEDLSDTNLIVKVLLCD